MTNFEKIKQMSVEEIAELLDNISESCYDKGYGFSNCGNCPLSILPSCASTGIKDWLESEVETE